MTLRRITLDAPYLLFMGDVSDPAELIAAAEEGNARLIDAVVADFLQEKC